MKLAGVLAAALVLAAPVAATAQGHGGAARAGVAAPAGPGLATGGGHVGGFHGPGPGRGFRDRFLLWGWPAWGWSDCGLYGDNCDWDATGQPGAPPAGYADASMTGPAPCGAWISRAGGYAWAPDACRDPPAAADPPPHAAVASNECSDWVWRADLRRSICRRPARTAG